MLTERPNKTDLVIGQNGETTLLPDAAVRALILQFSFALPEGRRYPLFSLISPDSWEILKNAVTSTVREIRLGHDGYKVAFQKNAPCGVPMVVEVFFASDLDDFPVWASVETSGGKSEVTVTQTAPMPIDDGNIILPLTIDVSETSADGVRSQLMRINVDPASLSVNAPLADPGFTIPTDKADKVWQADLKVWLK